MIALCGFIKWWEKASFGHGDLAELRSQNLRMPTGRRGWRRLPGLVLEAESELDAALVREELVAAW